MPTDGSSGSRRKLRARSAVGLELLPGVFAAIAVVLVVVEIELDITRGIVFDHGQLPGTFLVASCLAGLGWIVTGRTLVGCVVMMARVFYLIVVLATVLVLAGVANWTWGLVLFAAAVFAAGILAPMVSALALSRAIARQSLATRDDEGT